MLERMSQGGIYDHLGGGFARYSTDEVWLVPHFEKMFTTTRSCLSCWRSRTPIDPIRCMRGERRRRSAG